MYAGRKVLVKIARSIWICRAENIERKNIQHDLRNEGEADEFLESMSIHPPVYIRLQK